MTIPIMSDQDRMKAIIDAIHGKMLIEHVRSAAMLTALADRLGEVLPASAAHLAEVASLAIEEELRRLLEEVRR